MTYDEFFERLRVETSDYEWRARENGEIRATSRLFDDVCPIESLWPDRSVHVRVLEDQVGQWLGLSDEQIADIVKASDTPLQDIEDDEVLALRLRILRTLGLKAGVVMLESYEDIRSRIAEEPTWFDHNGVPRYGAFSPMRGPNIYANEVALLEIACQSCGARFKVEMSSYTDLAGDPPGERLLSNRIEHLHYGDPPRHDCPGGGETMNCDDLRVVEFWKRERASEWKRRPEHEVAFG